MKTTTNKTLATLNASLLAARNDLRVWDRAGIPAAQKLAEIAALEAQIAKLS